MKEKINKYFNEREMLCLNCYLSKIIDKKEIICSKTGAEPDFTFFCPYFRLNKSSKYNNDNHFRVSEKRAYSNKTVFEIYKDKKIKKIIWFFAILLVLSIIFFSNYRFLSIFLVAVIAFVYIVSLNVFNTDEKEFKRLKFIDFRDSLPGLTFQKYIHIPYYFLILSIYAYNMKENKSDDDLKIIEQNLIRIFGRKYLFYAKSFLNEGVDDEIFDINFRKHIFKIEYRYRLIIFNVLCEIYAYDNLDDFLKSKVVRKIADILEIEPKDFTEFKKETATQEYENQIKKEIERQKAEEEKRQREEYRKKAYQIYSIRRKDYYNLIFTIFRHNIKNFQNFILFFSDFRCNNFTVRHFYFMNFF